MTKQNLIEQISRIIHEDQANPERINELLLTYRIGLGEVTLTENEILIVCAANVFGISPEKVIESRRFREHVGARQMIWKWLKIHKPHMNLTKVAKVTNKTEHSNVIHGREAITNLIETDKDTRQKWERFNQLVDDRLNK